MSIELAQWLLGFMGCRMTFFRPFGGTPLRFLARPGPCSFGLYVPRASPFGPSFMVAGVWGAMWHPILGNFFILKSVPPYVFSHARGAVT
jgi:hypothetical protein